MLKNIYCQTPSIYHGENALHIAVVAQKKELALQLLADSDEIDRDKLMQARANGRFFVPDKTSRDDSRMARSDSHLYFGSLPLSLNIYI